MVYIKISNFYMPHSVQLILFLLPVINQRKYCLRFATMIFQIDPKIYRQDALVLKAISFEMNDINPIIK